MGFGLTFRGLPPFFPFALAASDLAALEMLPSIAAGLIGFLQWGQFTTTPILF